MNLRVTLTICLTFILAGLATLEISAQSCPGSAGCLDPTFNGTGFTLIPTDFGGSQRDGVIQSDGKAVSLSDHPGSGMMLTRVNPDGTPDTTFGGLGTGVLYTDWMHPGGFPFGIAIQLVSGEERLVVAGSWNIPRGRGTIEGLRVDRFLPNGAVDTSFGNGGTVFYETGYALAVAIQPNDQKILTVGDRGVLVRLNADGSLDKTFGKSGKVTIAEGGLSIKPLANGKILVGGGGYNVGSASGIGVTRFNANGTLDTTFGNKGKAVATFFGNNSLARAFRIDTDPFGNIIAGGFARPGGASIHDNDFVGVRFTASGQLDTTLNGTGMVNYDFGGIQTSPRSIVAQFDGKLILTGSAILSSSPASHDFVLIRYNFDGTLDTTFGNNGLVHTDLGGSNYSFTARVWTDPTCSCEKIVMMGGGTYISFARYLTQ